MNGLEPEEPAQQAVILAAGLGSRLSGHLVPKPLRPVLGITLLERTIHSLYGSGVREIIVVCGYRGAEVAQVATAVQLPNGTVRCVDNPNWRLANGVSLLAAQPYLTGRFLVSMSDHLLSTGMVRQMAMVKPPDHGAALATDPRLDQIFDMDDATKVLADTDGYITDIGKEIPRFDRIDTGLFCCTTGLLETLRSQYETNGDCSLSQGVKELAKQRRMIACNIGKNDWWQDVDTPAAATHAEQLLREKQQE
ncbi:MAG: NTP transferase domain-containing protein [Myxococcales bacterium]|nr:NTP transferase domain-containing protein [Myxococcales bacterium]